ncbi:hypothetical protein BB561_002299 [Smittium simulii]|uniref:Large ribosomal subunit protein bL32m n=1 Tax=Smittium simulii TaxID=133385 RepID=A0A2T9YQV4_9FUNG|nr:hypothetical protein BB561_002299 [Smittium simulii]
MSALQIKGLQHNTNLLVLSNIFKSVFSRRVNAINATPKASEPCVRVIADLNTFSPFKFALSALETVKFGLGWGIGSTIRDILTEAILRAAPKKKTTHSKKRMRASNKALKNRKDIVRCSACGRAKLLAHVCAYCYKDIKEKMKNTNTI